MPGFLLRVCHSVGSVTNDDLLTDARGSLASTLTSTLAGVLRGILGLLTAAIIATSQREYRQAPNEQYRHDD
jgi:hypothetical protein